MAIREYKCPKCELKVEKILPISVTPWPTMPCPRVGCDGTAEFLTIPTSFNLGTENFSEKKVDVAIGKDANRRWEDLHNRQSLRDKVRQQSGQAGLSMVGRNEFVPLPETEKVARTEAAEAVTVEGFKHQPDTARDKKLLGSD